MLPPPFAAFSLAVLRRCSFRLVVLWTFSQKSTIYFLPPPTALLQEEPFLIFIYICRPLPPPSLPFTPRYVPFLFPPLLLSVAPAGAACSYIFPNLLFPFEYSPSVDFSFFSHFFFFFSRTQWGRPVRSFLILSSLNRHVRLPSPPKSLG